MKMKRSAMSTKMWIYTFICVFVVLSSSAVVRYFSGVYTGYKNNMSYFLKKSYSSSTDLFSTMIEKPKMFFLWCCDCILYYANEYGMSYAELNLYLFVIGQPMLITLFAGLFIMQTIRIKNLK
jgi:hypothetical protein